MNPKRTIFVGVLVLMMAMATIPFASALTVTQEKLDLVTGLADSETYALTVDGNLLYVAGVKWYDKELTISSWQGQGHKASELATYDMGDYVYYPTNIVKFDGKFYISVLNWSSPDGNGVFETPLFVFDPDSNDIDVAVTFLHGMIGQMTIWDDNLVLMADYNTIYVSDDGEDFTAKYVVDDITGFIDGDTTLYFYLYDIHNLGITTMDGDLYLESRNCTWMHDMSSLMKLDGGDQPLGPSPTYEHFISESIDFHQLSDIDDAWTNEVTTHSLSRTQNWRDATYKNITNPLYTLPNDAAFAFVADDAVYTSDSDFTYTRIYNGDSLRNPEPVLAGKLNGNSLKPNSVLVNTVNAGDNHPACPAPIAVPDIGLASKPQPITKKVMQSFNAESVIPVGRDTFEVDTKTGKTTFIFTNSVQVLWSEVDFAPGSIVIASTTGIFTWHVITIDLTGAINSLMLALLIIGIVFVVFGIATWNKGLEDILALSLGGAMISGGVLLYLFPVMYLSWLLLLIPVALFFGLMYYFVTTYKAHRLDFRFKSFDTVWIVAIVGIFIAIELYCGWFTNTFYPGWLPPP